MEKAIVNINEFYTTNYWDDVLGKELASKAASLANSGTRLSSLKELERDFWSVKDSIKAESGSNGQVTDADVLVRLYTTFLSALGFTQVWQKRTGLESGETFTTFFEGGADGSRVLGFLTAMIETGDFESIPIFGASLEDDEDKDERTISEILDDEFLNSQDPPRWVVVCAPNAIFLIERTKWSAGRYLQIDLEDALTQRKDDVYSEMLGLLSREHLCPDSGRALHDDLDESSHRHAFAVTTALREAVRQSIEDLINELVYARRQAHKKFMPEGEPEAFARELTHDALFYVYRLIFLMYVESHDDDTVLPLKSEIYRNGYSIEKLIEVAQQDLLPGSADYEGYFLQDSLEKIFSIVWNGFGGTVTEDVFSSGGVKTYSRTGFFVKGLKADLFDPAKAPHLTGTKIRNHVLQQILKRLSWTKPEGRRGQVGRISYSALGINQLGAVYEGLLSYTGYFAKEPLVALKPKSVSQDDINKGKELDQIYLCPKSLAETYRNSKEKVYRLTDDNFVLEPDGSREIEFPRGSFIYRMAGRDRQKLASYYTPESLTKLTVKYALKVLYETKKTPEDLLSVKILEPAMGSGAFLNEAVTQIADRVLELEVQANPKTFPKPDDKKKRLNDIKYHLVSHCVYGVDLNPTAIELARFSLWLNCLGAGKDPPDLKDKLKVGNSLIGARFDKTVSGVYPWLLLDKGMADYGNKLRDYDAEGFGKLRDYRRNLLASSLLPTDEKVVKVQRSVDDLFAILHSESNKKSDAYHKLKLAADLWCSLFFVTPIDSRVMPPTHQRLLELFTEIFAEGKLPSEIADIVKMSTAKERFFHWCLEYAQPIAGGGFDLILANPPWVAVSWQDALYVSDVNPVPAVLELNAASTRAFVSQLGSSSLQQYLSEQYIQVAGYTNLLGVDFYANTFGGVKNTYKAFVELELHLLSKDGVTGVIQEDGILEDDDANILRSKIYNRFRYHFQFQNEFDLFADVDHKKKYSVNILGPISSTDRWYHIGNLFSPKTVDDCFYHTSTNDPVPLVKRFDDNHRAHWDSRGHKNRIIEIGSETLTTFCNFLNVESPSPPFLNLHSVELLGFVKKIGQCKTTLADLAGAGNFALSEMIHETGGQDRGWIKVCPNKPKRPDQLVLSGPNIGELNPNIKECREVYRVNADYDDVDLETASPDFLPRTVYQFVGKLSEIDQLLPVLDGRPYRTHFRLLVRRRMNATGKRCIYSAICSPETMHIHPISSIALSDVALLVKSAGYVSSLTIDAIFRLKNTTDFYPSNFASMPLPAQSSFDDSIKRRVLALNCVSNSFAALWDKCGDLQTDLDFLLNGTKLPEYGAKYDYSTILRKLSDREQALIEIDALVALSLGMSSDELVQIYEVLFPVMSGYDREANFDRAGLMRHAHKFFSDRGW